MLSADDGRPSSRDGACGPIDQLMSQREFRFTIALLRDYCDAAIKNASELLGEATLLQTNGHSARAYFLAVASIEEIGKAIQAFDAQGRNLADSAVTAKLRRSMEDHSQKLTSAFGAMLVASPDIRKDAMPVVDLMIHLKHGREPSMYTDIRYEESEVQVPAVMVRTAAANDCVRLARDCLRLARKHLENAPQTRSKADDQLFAMKSGLLQKMLNTEGFWWYYISQKESGKEDFASAAVDYQRDYFSKGKTFARPDEAKGSA